MLRPDQAGITKHVSLVILRHDVGCLVPRCDAHDSGVAPETKDPIGGKVGQNAVVSKRIHCRRVLVVHYIGRPE